MCEVFSFSIAPIGWPTFKKKGWFWGEIHPQAFDHSCTYVRKPNEIQWAYTEVDGTPLYNANDSVDFELHESDETSLVIKILSYSGVIVRQLEVTEVAEAKENKTVTQEKS